MQRLRSVLAVTCTGIAFAVSFVMLARVIGLTSPWLALLLMFYFLGLARVAEPLFMLRMPATLRNVRPWEQSGSNYRQLAVQQFGKLHRGTPLRYLNGNVYLTSAAQDVRSLHRRTASAEATHFWASVLFTPYIGYLFLAGQASVAALFLVVQLLFNVYPILHLRSVRARLDELLHGQHERIERSHVPAVGDA